MLVDQKEYSKLLRRENAPLNTHFHLRRRMDVEASGPADQDSERAYWCHSP